jgi:hypothetical protein
MLKERPLERLDPLMVRISGASFNSQFNIRAASMKKLLAQYARLGDELSNLQQTIVDNLHYLVPRILEPAQRHLLLKIKRNIFNQRALPQDSGLAANGPLEMMLKRYEELRSRKNTLLEAGRHDVMRELRDGLEALVLHEGFCAAVDYSCPWLLDAYHRHPRPEADFSDGERGVYSYAVKFFSKANPFYTFASISLLSGKEPLTGCTHQVILDTAIIHGLEQLLLPLVQDDYRRKISFAPFVEEQDGYQFFLVQSDQVRVVFVKKTPIVDELLAYLRESESPTFGGAMDHLCAAFTNLSRPAVADLLAVLARRSIFTEFLIGDVDTFAADLSGISAEHERTVEELGRLHLKLVSEKELPDIHCRIMRAKMPLSATERRPETLYYVDKYDPEAADIHRQLVGDTAKELEALKPAFIFSNYFEQSYVVRAFIKEKLSSTPNGKISYFELAREFLRHPDEIVSRCHPRGHRSRQENESDANWLSRLAAMQGTLTTETLQSALYRNGNSASERRSLCFNGPYDYRSRTFYLANIFAGDGRFASRFLLHDHSRYPAPEKADDAVLDVQLIVELQQNRNYLVPRFSAGCGFNSRYKSRFDRWIDPGNIIIEWAGDEVIYRDNLSGQRLRFHFVGFYLAEHLLGPYRLLLAEHADYYPNPFDETPQKFPEAGTVFVPGLYYGSICLRRNAWAMAKSMFSSLCSARDIVTSAVMLWDLVRRQTRTDLDYWYFRVMLPSGKRTKPRYLQLSNPLSTHMFRRALGQAPEGSAVLLSPMEPPPESLFIKRGERFVTELMIEV